MRLILPILYHDENDIVLENLGIDTNLGKNLIYALSPIEVDKMIQSC